jgi:endonuclease/exonuclease/phosphatase family metal-dependent hydrolase
MPEIDEKPPQIVSDELILLNQDLDSAIPAKSDDNLIIATWNLRMFGDLKKEWRSAKDDKPKRDLHSLLCIIEIIKRFDIVAVQEVRDNIKCLRDTMYMLGEDWSFIMTDVTRGHEGNNERLVFIFNSKKVKLSGLACEIVIPDEELKKNILLPDSLQRQFVRTPYAVSFKVKDKTFVLLTLHTIYGKNEKSRVPELKALAEWMKSWAKDLCRWGHSLMTLGDFNIDKKGDIAYEAFISTGLDTPDDLGNFNRTIFGSTTFYDQIAWFRDSARLSKINLKYRKGGVYNFKDKVLMYCGYTPEELSFRISDHMPLWGEFEL